MKQFFNIIIPMAGRGSRFKNAGYEDSKPFIDIKGKPMIVRVLENLNIEFDSNFKTILLTQQEDFDKYDFAQIFNTIGHENIEIVKLDGITEGAACTLLLAKEFINNDTPILSLNSDQLLDYNPEETYFPYKNYDGGIVCFDSDDIRFSFAKINENGLVSEVAEKKVISTNATAGYYYWSKGSDFVKYAEEMINANDRVNNEFYVAPVYNYAIKDGKRITITYVDRIHSTGTPEQLEKFLNEESSYFIESL